MTNTSAITISDEARAWLKDLAREYPNEISKAMATLAMAMRKRMAKEIASGTAFTNTFPPLANETFAYRRMRGNRRRNFGGLLPTLLRYRYDRTKKSAAVGWLEEFTPGIDKTAILFQTSASRPTTKGERHIMHRLGLPVRQTYERPARLSIANFAEDTDYILRVVRRRIQSIIEKRNIAMAANAAGGNDAT